MIPSKWIAGCLAAAVGVPEDITTRAVGHMVEHFKSGTKPQPIRGALYSKPGGQAFLYVSRDGYIFWLQPDGPQATDTAPLAQMAPVIPYPGIADDIDVPALIERIEAMDTTGDLLAVYGTSTFGYDVAVMPCGRFEHAHWLGLDLGFVDAVALRDFLNGIALGLAHREMIPNKDPVQT